MTNTASQNHRHGQVSTFDSLEPRLMFSATSAQIAQALSLPIGTDVTYVGNPAAVAVRNIRTQAGLAPGLFTGGNDSALILSTGDASWFDTKTKQQAGRGTDFGNDGLPDTASVTFTIDVPASSRPQRLRFDCMMLSQEYDEWVHSDFDDSFTATCTSQVSNSQVFESINTSDIDFAGHLDVSGTYFDGRTKMDTATFNIPSGATSLTITLSIADATDGLYDSDIVIDNLRIEKQELVYLDFGGGSVGNLFGYGTTTVLPAFDPSDVRSSEDSATLIGQIETAVANKFQGYNITFTTTQPDEGPYTTIVIGGSGSTPTHLDPIIQSLKLLPPNTTLGSFFGDTLPLGMADAEDLNNVQHDNLCAVLSGNFVASGVYAINDLAVTICHELGHSLGLRDDTGVYDIMNTDLGSDFEGHDTFTYAITDPDGNTGNGTVYVAVGNVPMAEGDQEVNNGHTMIIPVLANDDPAQPGDVLTITAVTQPSHGTVTISGDGLSLTYKPTGSDADQFTYTIRDQRGETDQATVTIVGDGYTPPTPPVAVDDYVRVDTASTPNILDVLANDVPVHPGDVLTISGTSQPGHGTVVVSDDGLSLTYKPASRGFDSGTSALAQTWLDGQTTQNDNAYLNGILGPDYGDGQLANTEQPTAVNITSAVKIYDVTIGVWSPSMPDVAPTYVHLKSLLGTQQVNLPIDSDDTQVFFFAASKSGGPIDIVSGTPTAAPVTAPAVLTAGVTPPAPTKIIGSLTLDATRLNVVSGGKITVPSIVTSKLRRDGQFEQPLGKAAAKATLATAYSNFFSNDTVNWMAPKTSTYIDSDGDIYTVSLSGPGLLSVYQDDPDGDGQGPISQILLENTTAASKLKITVRKAGGGDGLVQVSEIIGADLGAINAPAVNIAGRGIHLSGVLGSLTMHDLTAGSAIYLGGTKTNAANLALQFIDDSAVISSQSTIGKFTAYGVGAADIDAPAIGTMTIRNNFAAAVTLGEQIGVATTLKKVCILGDASNSQWHIFSGLVGTVTVAGDADDMLFYTSAGIAKMSFAGMVGSQIYAGLPEPSAFTKTVATSDGMLPDDSAQFYPAQIKSLVIGTLADSCIAAGTMGTVSIRSITTDNSGRAFGVATTAMNRLNLPAPALPLKKLTDIGQSLNVDDFVVQIV